MYKSHVIKLYPTQKQETFFLRSCGTARFAYNWALSTWKAKYENGEKTSAFSLIKELTAIKRKEFPWMTEVGKTCPQYAIHNLEAAYNNFFKKNAKYPKYKKRGVRDSFVAIENRLSFKQNDFKIWIPRLGWVKCAENLRFDGKVNSVTVKKVADLWFAVVSLEICQNVTPVVRENQAIIGVDLGIKYMAVTSNGEVFENPKSLGKRLKSLKYQHRSLCRKVKGSANRKKQQIKLARLYYKIKCTRDYAIHNATSKIVQNADIIVLEDLNVHGMIKNHNLSRALSDVGFGEFRRQIEYKAVWSGKQVVIAPRFMPSSKTCSVCGSVKQGLTLRDRTYSCVVCGSVMDRDLNATRNLANYALRQSLPEVRLAEAGVRYNVLSPPEKQELNNCLTILN